MFLSSRGQRLALPESLWMQMLAFRRRVWAIRLIEACCGAAFGVLMGYLITFCLDRVWDTPAIVRLGIFAAAIIACASVPYTLHRWVWRQRKPEQLARLLSRTHPRVGDQLLGIVELVGNESEQARSLALCEAAVRQVAEQAKSVDFTNAVPNPRHRPWAVLAISAIAAGVGLFLVYPSAAANAWARFLNPLGETPRYTFATVDQLPDNLVVAHGEPFSLPVTLAEQTESRPAQAEARVGAQQPVVKQLEGTRYPFEFPAQIEAGTMNVRVGDYTKQIRVEPTLRPELTAVEVEVALPEYLGRTKAVKKDGRGGSVSVLKGSVTKVVATATRELTSAKVDGKPVDPQGATVVGSTPVIAGERRINFQWQDRFGLSGKEPFVLTINGREDEAPSISCDGMPSRKVVLDIEHLSFKVLARDDYGVKRVGMEWRGVDTVNFKTPASGERILAAGGPEQEQLEVNGTFSAHSLGIEPQPIQVRIFVEDYFPGRTPTYSPPYLLYVLNAEQHAIWLTEQLNKWHRMSLEVRDKELQLFETNKQFRELSADELNQPENQRRLQVQAEAERANGRRLSNLVENGEDLVKQAMRNPEFGVGHLEKWAEMLQILKDISSNRMPSVADLLKQAAQGGGSKGNGPKAGPMAGQARSGGGGKPVEFAKATPKPAAPSLADIESSQQPPAPGDNTPGGKVKPSSPSLGLPTTGLPGGKSKGPAPNAADEQVEEAVKQQQDLLAEFDKVADELNRILANLEGSTLVKRLKAQSRVQTRVSTRLGDQVTNSFGAAPNAVKDKRDQSKELAAVELKSSQDVSNIVDDLQSYFERRRMVKFKNVLDEMLKYDAVGGIRQLSEDLPKENGLSIAQCEYWSDTLDRWAEDLVDPSCCGACPGGKSRDSLPPSIVLEVLQILEGEVNLREDTRVAQQAKPATEKKQYVQQASGLSKRQDKFRDRIDKVIPRIKDLPNGESTFAKEIALLKAVSEVMNEATEIMARPETGSLAIAAETEAIELLLQSKRFSPKSGGGGGANPGGGGSGSTNDSALSLIGKGVNEKEVRQAPKAAQATGDTGSKLPEEFRTGLDAYFNGLEKGSR